MNWQNALMGTKHTIRYANPIFGTETPFTEMDLALISLEKSVPQTIEVTWDDEEECFVINLFADKFRQHLNEKRVKTYEEAVAAIHELSQQSIVEFYRMELITTVGTLKFKITDAAKCDVQIVTAGGSRAIPNEKTSPSSDLNQRLARDFPLTPVAQ